MGKFQGKEEKEIWEPSQEDARSLRVKLQEYEPDYRSRFERYMESLGIIRFDEFKQIVVRQPENFWKFQQILAKMEGQDYAERERNFKAFPEEKEKYLIKLSETLAKAKGILETKKVIVDNSLAENNL